MTNTTPPDAKNQADTSAASFEMTLRSTSPPQMSLRQLHLEAQQPRRNTNTDNSLAVGRDHQQRQQLLDRLSATLQVALDLLQDDSDLEELDEVHEDGSQPH